MLMGPAMEAFIKKRHPKTGTRWNKWGRGFEERKMTNGGEGIPSPTSSRRSMLRQKQQWTYSDGWAGAETALRAEERSSFEKSKEDRLDHLRVYRLAAMSVSPEQMKMLKATRLP